MRAQRLRRRALRGYAIAPLLHFVPQRLRRPFNPLRGKLARRSVRLQGFSIPFYLFRVFAIRIIRAA